MRIAVVGATGGIGARLTRNLLSAGHQVKALSRGGPALDALVELGAEPFLGSFDVLEDAQRSPSNCNTQPWNTHIVSGERIAGLGRLLTAQNEAQRFTPDFTFDMECFYGAYGERRRAHGKTFYEAMGVAREDRAGRDKASASNYSFFGAPHAALLFMPSFGDNVRVTDDIGMYGQTFLLSLAARGLGGIPQTAIGFFAQTIREYLGISDELKLMFAISFGHPDYSAPVNGIRMGRVPVSESVTFHR